jgi:hypothetical protein
VSEEFDIIFCSLAPKGESMEQSKSKYEVAKEILDELSIVSTAWETAKDIENEPEKTEKALDWYLEQYKKVSRAMDNS